MRTFLIASLLIATLIVAAVPQVQLDEGTKKPTFPDFNTGFYIIEVYPAGYTFIGLPVYFGHGAWDILTSWLETHNFAKTVKDRAGAPVALNAKLSMRGVHAQAETTWVSLGQVQRVNTVENSLKESLYSFSWRHRKAVLLKSLLYPPDAL